ncbi:MAG: non-heme iron oxygenase ferredoxin subunit [Candidatus Planktophila sp.]
MSDLSLSAMVSGQPIKIEKEGESICVTRIGDDVFAVADTCSHAEASLSEGEVTDYKIECWLHGAEFDLRTGQAITPPAVAPIKVYSVSVDGDSVTVDA